MEMVMAASAACWWVTGWARAQIERNRHYYAITMGGGGVVFDGTGYLWIADITVGHSGSLMWFVVGAIGGVAGE
jgi:hypothetical protein